MAATTERDSQRAGEMDFQHTGPGTLAGRYLRSFWQPVSRSKDLPPGKAVPVKVMSEDFTVYRGQGGEAHVVAFRCAHRGTQLSVGWVEGDCIRCRYHGWMYDASGQCVDQPGEDESFKSRVHIRSYPTQEYLGLVFAYLGEGEPPPLRRFPDFDRPFYTDTGAPEVWPCNFFNRLDNDPAHVPFTHRESTLRTIPGSPINVRETIAEETEYGLISSVIQPGRPPFHVHFHMPNINQTRSVTRVEGSIEDARKLFVDRLFWRLPIDDENCISYMVDMLHLTGADAEAYAERRKAAEQASGESPNALGQAVLDGKMRIEDMDPEISMYKLFWVEDYATQVGQGAMGDRSNEHLGRIDQTVTLKRALWQRELRALNDGRPLKNWTEPAGLADMTAPVGTAGHVN